MRLRRAVLQNPSKSSVPSQLLFYKSRSFRTRSESTLPQLLIPLHFNSRTINTYKKPGGGYPPPNPKVLQLVTPRLSPRCPFSVPSSFSPFNFKLSTFNVSSLSPVPATLTTSLQ